MSVPPTLRMEIDGRTAATEQLRFLALVNYGHHTVMQVRDGHARGVDLHLTRLDAATRELFGFALDGNRVRDHIRHALGDDIGDASVRVVVFQPDPGNEPSIMVVIRPPAEMPSAPQSLRSVPYQRPVAHIKHLGSFGQIHYGRLAEREGYDEALLTGPDGVISEGAISNIAFFDGGEIAWPDAPALTGITMGLLERKLGDAGLPSRRRTVRLADLSSYDAAFITNSTGIAPVGRIDNLTFSVDAELMKTVTQVYESTPWDAI
jgi:branched-subunit amino acid aminotransferase/4-amino-4-deoxychorismate lyase